MRAGWIPLFDLDSGRLSHSLLPRKPVGLEHCPEGGHRWRPLRPHRQLRERGPSFCLSREWRLPCRPMRTGRSTQQYRLRPRPAPPPPFPGHWPRTLPALRSPGPPGARPAFGAPVETLFLTFPCLDCVVSMDLLLPPVPTTNAMVTPGPGHLLGRLHLGVSQTDILTLWPQLPFPPPSPPLSPGCSCCACFLNPINIILLPAPPQGHFLPSFSRSSWSHRHPQRP